jgi:hypothetical protein
VEAKIFLSELIKLRPVLKDVSIIMDDRDEVYPADLEVAKKVLASAVGKIGYFQSMPP